MDRKYLTISLEVNEIFEKEIDRRNRKLKPGERSHTKQSATEEAILFWKENKK